MGVDLSQVFKKMEIKEWIARDSYLVTRVEMDVLMELSPEGSGEGPLFSFGWNINMRMSD